MTRFFIAFLSIATVFSFGSCAVPSNWNELLGSDAPLFPETILSAKSGLVFHSRVLRELSDMLNDPEISSQIYDKYLAEYEKPETRNNINVFKKNLMLIAKRNLLFHTGKSTWEEGVNQFTDMPTQELEQYFGGLPADPDPEPESTFSVANLTLKPAAGSLDWRDLGAVGPVKNQGACGSCWSFSANVAVEGNLAKSTGQAVVPLSEQELVDCHKQSCKGEMPWKAIEYIKQNGIASSADYPYTSGSGRAGTCDSTKTKAAKVVSYVRSKKESEYRALTALYGPFSGALYYHGDMTRQKSGVYDGACGEKDGKRSGFHAIGIVGYGTENGVNYWIIRNSYGEKFADKGYVKIIADVDKCGLESYLGATFVTAVKKL